MFKTPDSSMISSTYDDLPDSDAEPAPSAIASASAVETLSTALTAVSGAPHGVLTAVIPQKQVEEEIRATVALAEDHFRDNTRRNYAVTWNNFTGWCGKRGLDPTAATPEIVATWLQTRFAAGSNPRSLDRFYSAVAARLREIQVDGGSIWARKRRPEIIYKVLRGARNERPTPLRQKKPLTPADYQYLADPARFKRKITEGKTWGVVARERAILLFGLATGVRRSELAVLRLSDVRFEERGVVVRLAQSVSARGVLGPGKTDREGIGRQLALLRGPDPLRCPVAALEGLCTHVRDLARAAAKRGAGPDPDEQPDAWCIFLPARPSRGGHALVATPRAHIEPSAVLRCVQEAAAELGKRAQDFGAHSLRTGCVTILAENGAPLEEIMEMTGHQSFEQVRGYIRRESPFDRNASRHFFGPKK